MPTNNKGSQVPKHNLFLPTNIDNSQYSYKPIHDNSNSQTHQPRLQPHDRNIFDLQTALKSFKPPKKINAQSTTINQDDSFVEINTFDDSHLQDSLTVKYENDGDHERDNQSEASANSVQNSLFKVKDDESVGRYLSQQIAKDCELALPYISL